jgi:uncharacterized coiled-coil protein SlyX
MFTEEEKKMMLDLLNSVSISGNRQTVRQMMEKVDRLVRKIEAMETEEAGPAEVPSPA